jgi:processive 1,2-diacylglycerol beta-glucosyltransferase/1,2-diacylglycerol 3-beta-galactosyltransferase
MQNNVHDERVLFLYLNTGSGHSTPARILAKALEDRGNVKTFLENGFAPRQYIARFLFEQGYHFFIMYARACYSLLYDIYTRPAALRLTTALVNWHTAPHIERLIRKNRITRIVCLHFALAPAAWRAVQRVNPAIPFFVVVTDPFTAPPAWFIVKGARYIVFSQELREKTLRDYGIADCRVFPFILKSEFAKIPETTQKQHEQAGAARPFRVLIAGGGEGLPGMVPLARYFLARQNCDARTGPAKRPAFTVTVVCGRNAKAYHTLSKLARPCPDSGVTIHGYVHNMPELLAQADCVITKAGPSLIMETLAYRKPLIVSTYIYGQELGNMRFVVQGGAGWFIQKPEGIYRKVCELAENPAYRQSIVQNSAALGIRPDLEGISEYLLEGHTEAQRRNLL